MKLKQMVFLLLLSAGMLCLADPPQVTVSNRHPRAGEVFFVTIHSDEGRPEVLEYPSMEGARFLPNHSSRSFQLVNFSRSYSLSVAVQAQKSGALTLPPLQVRVGKKVYTTPEIPLQTASSRISAGDPAAAEPVSGGESLFGELSTGGETFYAGQEIPVECTLYVPDGVEIRQLGYPEIESDKAVFADYRKVNPEHPRFLRPVQRGREKIRGRTCRSIVFRTSARIFEPGTYTFSAVSPAAVAEERPEPDDDPFASFSFFTGRRSRMVKVSYAAKPFVIRALPPEPQNSFFTGLIGSSTIRFSLSGKKPAVGELLTLECLVKGAEGAQESLKAPELNLAGFRVYPPEIRRNKEGETVIRYAMIPLKEGKTPLNLALTVFDAGKGEYRTFHFERMLQVAPSPAGQTSAGTPAVSSPARKSAGTSPAAAAPVWKLKAADGRRVKLPLWRNCALFSGTAVAAGILLILGSLLAELLRRRRESDPDYARKKAASAARKTFLTKLRSAASAAEVTETANRELCEYLSAKFGLPAGASATEIAACLRDPEDAKLLEEAGESAFQPGTSRSLVAWKSGLLRLLKHVGAVILFCSVFSLSADEGIAAFERGDNQTAIRYFAGRGSADAPELAALYNLGCVLAAEGNDPYALAAFTRALRLEPRSGDTLAHLNEVRARLLLPPERSTESPAELLRTARDQFRPDEYAAVCAGLFLLFAAGFCFRRKLGKTLFSGFALSILALELLSLTALGFQLRGPYSPRHAFITARKAELRTLPAEKSGRVEATLSGGTPVEILDEREHYVLISGAGLEGWIRREDIRRVFSDSLFP